MNYHWLLIKEQKGGDRPALSKVIIPETIFDQNHFFDNDLDAFRRTIA